MKGYTYSQIEEMVLEQLYIKNQERPLWITASEIYWSINGTDVSERDVIETLEKLVKERRVIKQLGKYQMDKREFLDIKKQKEECIDTLQEDEDYKSSNNAGIKKTERRIDTMTGRNRTGTGLIIKFITWMLILILGILIGFLSYNIFMQHNHDVSDVQIPKSEIILENTRMTVSARTEDDIKYSIIKLGKEINRQKDIDKFLVLQNDSLRQAVAALAREIRLSQEKRDAMLKEQQNFLLTGLCVTLSLMILVLTANTFYRQQI